MKTLPLFADLDCDPMSSQPGGPAKETAWLDGVLEWLTNEADCGTKSPAFLPSSVPSGFLEKTSPEFCPSTTDGIGLPYSGTWQAWGMGSPTAFLTLSGSECPSGAVVCSLSDILETGDVPRKYYLSAKACRGILRRAEKRGRVLPKQLAQALQDVATQAEEITED